MYTLSAPGRAAEHGEEKSCTFGLNNMVCKWRLMSAKYWHTEYINPFMTESKTNLNPSLATLMCVKKYPGKLFHVFFLFFFQEKLGFHLVVMDNGSLLLFCLLSKED